MAEQFLHGVEIVQVDTKWRPIQTVKSSVIGLIGTAPNADPAKYPLDTPVLMLGNRYQSADFGATGTLKDALDAIYDHIGAWVVVVRVAEGTTLDQTVANIVGSYQARTGVHAFYKAGPNLRVIPRLLIAPGFTSQRMTGGVTQISVTAGGTGYSNAAVAIAGAGVGAKAQAVITAGAITGIIITNPGFGYTAAPTVTITGDSTGATAEATIGTAANPVVAELLGIAARLRGTIIADAATTPEASVLYRQDWDSERILAVDNRPLFFDTDLAAHVAQPASARIAGLQALIDNTEGFWVSPSNHIIQGITGTARPVDFSRSDPNSEANYLNANDVATIIHHEGFRLWGNHGCSSDPLWKFWCVGRTRDMIYESMEQAVLWAVDKPISAELFEALAQQVNYYLRHLKAAGAIVGGECWIDPNFNTPDQLVQGKVTFSFDFEPVAPAEHIVGRAHREPGYYQDLIDQVVLSLAA
jgi:phage tail sheath protein FI